MEEFKMKKCSLCKHFEPGTRFCRFNPPAAAINVNIDEGNRITSLFPMIRKPELDYCSKFERSNGMVESVDNDTQVFKD